MSNLLELENLCKYFNTNRGLLHAVESISLSVKEKTTLGVVGESGCGKSTLGRTIIGLTDATSGKIIFDGVDITNAKSHQRRELRKKMQMIFQDPYSSLDPRMTVKQLIAEPMFTFGKYGSKKDVYKRVTELMDTVGLAQRIADSYPHELDGGRRQRIGVARSLIMEPSFIICDEPVSALDVSIQAQIINLLQDLQEQRQLTYIFITHDLSVVKHISDEIMVMYLGCQVEKSETEDLFRHPLHPYTKALLSAIPVPSLRAERKKIPLIGEITTPINPKPACRFAARCPYADRICTEKMPELKELIPNHFCACHYAEKINAIKEPVNAGQSKKEDTE